MLDRKRDRMPRTRDIIRQLEVADENAFVGEEAKLAAHRARDQQVSFGRHCNSARLVSDLPLCAIAMPVQLTPHSQA